jgi:superfamily I DNA/RNA helicase
VARVAPTAWEPKGIDELEPAAWDALRHDGSACVAAGPGAGKTEFLAQRADYLLSTGLCRRPRNILAISFKRDAARNLAERVDKRSPETSSRFHSMTFDAFTKGLVDRFRAALPTCWALRGDYEIRFPAQREISAFLDDLAASSDEWRAGLHGIQRGIFLPAIVGDYLLPNDVPQPESAEAFAVLSWWRTVYLERDPQLVDFVMLNRLAELIIRSTTQIQRALQMTYPFVFVDEFQDTTYAQYSFLRSVFSGGRSVVTAVGDNKQRIMGWAGALDDAFQELEADFDAELFELEWNFRSSDELIEVQHVVALTLDSTAKRAVSMAGSSIEGAAAEIWRFASEEEEARCIADWIVADCAEFYRSPAEYALLARQKSADFEPLFTRELARVGVRLRNDDREVGRLRLQDLLADDLAMILLGLLRLGASTGGNGRVWTAVSDAIVRLHGLEHAQDAGYDADFSLSTFIKRFRSWLRAHEPTQAAAHVATDLAMKFVGAGAVRRVFASHRTLDAVELVVEAFKIRMEQVANPDLSWTQVCDEFEGRDAVALMTVHKSKGLEYHTVFFLSIDDRQWWSFPQDPEASTATFFVGLSRAEQRTIFTYCAERGDREAVEALYGLLEAAGVAEREP